MKKFVRASKEYIQDTFKSPSWATRIKRVIRDHPIKSSVSAVTGVGAAGAAGTYAYKKHKGTKSSI